MSVFKEFLQEQYDDNHRIKVYLKPIPQIEGQSNTKSSNIMLSGNIKAFDDVGLWLEEQTCFVAFDSIKSIKPA